MFVITQMSLLCIFPPTMTLGPSVGILTLIINSRGPNYQIKSVMTGLAINNYSIFKTSGGELKLFMQFYIILKYSQIRNAPGC